MQHQSYSNDRGRVLGRMEVVRVSSFNGLGELVSLPSGHFWNPVSQEQLGESMVVLGWMGRKFIQLELSPVQGYSLKKSIHELRLICSLGIKIAATTCIFHKNKSSGY